MVRVCDEIDEGNRRPYGKARMSRFQSPVLAISAMAGAIKTAQLRKVLCQGRKIP